MQSARMEVVLAGCCGWRFAGGATIAGELYDAGDYPALVPNRRSTPRVRGRIVEVDDAAAALTRLDDYEGVREGLYGRRRRRVEVEDGSRRVAWVYEYARPVDGMPRIRVWPTPARRPRQATR